MFSFFFFFNDTATTEIYTLSLHDALPICTGVVRMARPVAEGGNGSESMPSACLRAGMVCCWITNPPSCTSGSHTPPRDRKSTRLNSSHLVISYAVFCLKKKKNSDQ